MSQPSGRFGIEPGPAFWRFGRVNPTPTPHAGTVAAGLIDWRALLPAWLICGVLDINAAFISANLTADRSPMWVLRAVAGALLGKASFDAGPWVGGLGLGLHFFVAFNAALVFHLLSRKFPGLLRHALPAGMLFGGCVYLFMNCVTLPFCSWFRSLYLDTPVVWAHARFGWPQFGIHLTCVGLGISLPMKYFSRRT